MTTSTDFPQTGLTSAPVPFARVLGVELRKTVDTRSGRWLLAAIGLITVGAVVISLLAAAPEWLTFSNLVGVTTAPQSLLLPVLAILTATTEWTQRTGVTTYTLEPRRGRVALAKLAAVLVLALAAVAIALAAAALGTVAGTVLRDGAGTWDLLAGGVAGTTVLQVLAVLQGFAFGMLLLHTAAAIVAYFVVPLLATVAFSVVGALEDVAPWLDLGSSTTPLSSGDPLAAAEWAQLAVAAVLWVGLPLAVGTVRLLRREVK